MTEKKQKPVLAGMSYRNHPCSLCRGHGQVFARKKSIKMSHSPYSFICSCKEGEKVSSDGIPVWSAKYSSDFAVIDPITNLIPGEPEEIDDANEFYNSLAARFSMLPKKNRSEHES